VLRPVPELIRNSRLSRGHSLSLMPIRCDQTFDTYAIVLLLLDAPFSLKGESTRNIVRTLNCCVRPSQYRSHSRTRNERKIVCTREAPPLGRRAPVRVTTTELSIAVSEVGE